MIIFSSTLGYQSILKPYQKARIESFIAAESSQYDTWNSDQAHTTLCSGSAFGKTFLECKQANFQLLPFPYTDFAFSCYAQQFGFVGVSLLLLIYLGLINEILTVGFKSKQKFSMYTSFGIAYLFTLHIFQHVSMNPGIVPINGMTLPLVSYGGSSLLTFMISIGIVQSIHRIHFYEPDKVIRFKAKKKTFNVN